MQILPMAAAFVGYIVFWNLSLQLNSVGFYQLSKILIAPAIILIEAVWFKKVPTRLELASVGVLCMGVTLATVSDSEVRGWHGYLHAWFRLPQALTCRSSGHEPSSGCAFVPKLNRSVQWHWHGSAWRHCADVVIAGGLLEGCCMDG